MNLKALITVSMLLLASSAKADEAILSIDVSGFIKPPPIWVDAAGQEIDTVVLSFDGYATRKRRHVKSSAAMIRLINAPTYPADVFLTRPRGCSIGTKQVAERDIWAQLDRQRISSDRLISFSDALRRLRLYFHRRGGYHATVGEVVCQSPGRLTYTY